MPTKRCNYPGCPDPAVTRGYCRVHAAERRKQTRSPFNSFYASKPWAATRRKQLYDHPLCQYLLDDGSECGRLAEVVHHIVDLRKGGAPRDPANLESLCVPHHNRVTRHRMGPAG